MPPGPAAPGGFAPGGIAPGGGGAPAEGGAPAGGVVPAGGVAPAGGAAPPGGVVPAGGGAPPGFAGGPAPPAAAGAAPAAEGGAAAGPPRPAAMAGGGGFWISASPLNPADVGSVSSAGNSSTRTYFDGGSNKISNSIGTRLFPRTRLVRPDATNVLTRSDPPSALRASASTCSAFLTDSGFGGEAAGWAGRAGGPCASATTAAPTIKGNATNGIRLPDAILLPNDTRE